LQKFRRRTVRRKKRQRDEIRRIARQDIIALFQLAAVESNRTYAKRYVAEAREISKRTRTPIPRQFRHSFCRICGTPWFGSQRRVRLRSSRKSRRRHIVFSCLVCGNARRIPLGDAR
jgi:RNase P subunit RPR2